MKFCELQLTSSDAMRWLLIDTGITFQWQVEEREDKMVVQLQATRETDYKYQLAIVKPLCLLRSSETSETF